MFRSCLCTVVTTILGFLVISTISASQVSLAVLFFSSINANDSETEINIWLLTRPSLAKSFSSLSSAFSTLISSSSVRMCPLANVGGSGGLSTVPSMCLRRFFDSKWVQRLAHHQGQLDPSVASFPTLRDSFSAWSPGPITYDLIMQLCSQ